jgi:uncharacterized RDD family membrane protein YckC
VGARLIDFAILSLVSLPASALAYYAMTRWVMTPTIWLVGFALAFLTLFLYFALFTAYGGQTPGKRVMGLQVQRPSGEPLRGGQAVVRALVDTLTLGLIQSGGLVNYLWAAFGKRHRAWHDLAAGTVVRKTRPLPAGPVLQVIAVTWLLVGLGGAPHRLMFADGVQLTHNMAPTIRKGELWEANRLAYRHRSPAIGDVVAFDATPIWDGARMVGRVVGVAGDHLALRNGALIHTAPRADGWLAADEVAVPAGSVAVLFDNHNSASTAASWQTPAMPPGLAGRYPPRPLSPILTIPTTSITGQVLGIRQPLYRLRAIH